MAERDDLHRLGFDRLPVKSPVATRFHPGATEPTNTFGVKPFPLDCHSVNVVPFCHSKSLAPSPLKSALATGVQPAPTEPTKLLGVKPLPVESQILNTPAPLLNQSRSDRPLLVKSPVPWRFQPDATEPTTTFGVKPLTEPRSIRQTVQNGQCRGCCRRKQNLD